jgi:hypothetical protein
MVFGKLTSSDAADALELLERLLGLLLDDMVLLLNADWVGRNAGTGEKARRAPNWRKRSREEIVAVVALTSGLAIHRRCEVDVWFVGSGVGLWMDVCGLIV